MRRESTIIIIVAHIAISLIAITGCGGKTVPIETTGPDKLVTQATPKFHLVTELGIVSSEELASNGKPTLLFFAASY